MQRSHAAGKTAGVASEHRQIATDAKDAKNKDDAVNTASTAEIDGPALPVPDFKTAMNDSLQALLKMSEAEFIARMRQFGCVPTDTSINRPVYARSSSYAELGCSGRPA